MNTAAHPHHTHAAFTDAQRDALAYQIADASVLADIESGAIATWIDGERWLDIRPMLDPREHSGEVIDMARQALQHAVTRGLVTQRLSVPHLVRIKR